MITPAHRLKINDYIIPFKTYVRSNVIRLPQLPFPMAYSEGAEMREIEEVIIQESKPWVGGLCWKILEVALPLILVQSCIKGDTTPPFLHMDTEMMDFIVVSPKYVSRYKKAWNAYYKITKQSTVAVVDNHGEDISQHTLITRDDLEKKNIDKLLQAIMETGGPDIEIGNV